MSQAEEKQKKVCDSIQLKAKSEIEKVKKAVEQHKQKLAMD
jgi:hypothetical protein